MRKQVLSLCIAAMIGGVEIVDEIPYAIVKYQDLVLYDSRVKQINYHYYIEGIIYGEDPFGTPPFSTASQTWVSESACFSVRSLGSWPDKRADKRANQNSRSINT